MEDKERPLHAHARLSAKNRFSTAATSSFYLVTAPLVPLVSETNMPAGGSKVIAVITLVISVFLIIITLLESAKNYQGEADRMHKCALEIQELCNRFQALPLEEANAIRKARNDDYCAILKKYEVNHSEIDFPRFQLAFGRDLKTQGAYGLALTRYLVLWLYEYWLYIVMLFAPPLAAWIFRVHAPSVSIIWISR